MILALPWVPVVITPACDPVNERACAPSDSMAIATSALEIRSPAVSSMSSSRGGGAGQTWRARSSSSSVVSPIAETTTTTSLPCFLVSTMRSATRRIRSASATEDPPYFCTTSATVCPFCTRGVAHKDKGSAHLLFSPRPQVTSDPCPTNPPTATPTPGCRSTRRSPPGGARGRSTRTPSSPANNCSPCWKPPAGPRPGVIVSRCGSSSGPAAERATRTLAAGASPAACSGAVTATRRPPGR